MKILFWGTYDTGKPRLRILMRGFKENNADIQECHFDVWKNIEDKTQIKSISKKIYYFFRLLISYPILLIRFLKTEKPDVLFIGYMGHFDIIIVYLLAKIRGIPIVWDAFISLYDTLVNDRKLISNNHILARTIHLVEKISCFCADLIVLDTDTHAKYFECKYKLKRNKLCATFVGVEPELFYKSYSRPIPNSVLFYGQFIPLHGINTIIEAAKMLENNGIHFTLIGSGQEASAIDEKINYLKIKNITRINWVNYEELLNEINKACVCLGIFGESGKASRVIPNKVFQILATGKPLITRDSPAIRELIKQDLNKIKLIDANNPVALCAAIKEMLNDNSRDYDHTVLLREFIPQAIGKKLIHSIYTKLIYHFRRE